MESGIGNPIQKLVLLEGGLSTKPIQQETYPKKVEDTDHNKNDLNFSAANAPDASAMFNAMMTGVVTSEQPSGINKQSVIKESPDQVQQHEIAKVKILEENDKDAGKQIKDGALPPDKPQSAWVRLKSYFDRDRTKADNVAKQDHIDQDQAEFRAAGNQLTAEKRFNNQESLLEKTSTNPSEADDLAFMRSFKGKAKESQDASPEAYAKRQARINEVRSVVADRAGQSENNEPNIEEKRQKDFLELVGDRVREYKESGIAEMGWPLIIPVDQNRSLSITFDKSSGKATIVEMFMGQSKESDEGSVIDLASKMAITPSSKILNDAA